VDRWSLDDAPADQGAAAVDGRAATNSTAAIAEGAPLVEV
jgi:hypothetical protein